MRRSPAERANLHVAAQVAAAWAKLDAPHRAGELAGALGSQDRTFLGAMRRCCTALAESKMRLLWWPRYVRP